MPINHEIDGDLLALFRDGRVIDHMAHGCNIFHKMGNGIAKQVRAEFPQAFDADLDTPKGDRSKLGTFSTSSHNHKIIFNLYTQATYWDVNDMLDYQAVEDCFVTLDALWITNMTQDMLGIPKIGAGLAMGDWDRIVEIIDKSTPNIPITLVNFKPN